ncbi:Uncharacterised protein [Mycobacteroides abscessus subsp. abscessus]|nr:Uncharacterised protein [Mycobacteroides abscessus subsp. abscessus]
MSARADVVDRRDGAFLIGRDRGCLGHVKHVEHVVNETPPLAFRHLGGADIHTAIQLHRVGIDDLPAQALGQLQRERRLAGGGGTDDRDGPCHDTRQMPAKYPTP